jgi:hypothetical protein
MVMLDGVSTARGARGLLQALGAVPSRGADSGPLDSGGGLGPRSARAHPPFSGDCRRVAPHACLVCTKEDAMLLGIDYGTTRTVVAAVDRGNYPVVSFHGGVPPSNG